MDENIGKIFGDYELIEYLEEMSKKCNNKYYRCKCLICGRTKQTALKHLINGKGISHKTCGLHIFNEKRNKGKWFKDYDKKFYQCWCDIRKRTTNPNSKSWKDYGEEG